MHEAIAGATVGATVAPTVPPCSDSLVIHCLSVTALLCIIRIEKCDMDRPTTVLLT